MIGRFGSAECSQRIRRIIFRSMVWSALLTSRADCKAFDKFTASKGRSLMRGKASGRWIDTDGTKRYHALTNAEVLRWLKLVPIHLELQVRRLRWWQTILMDREGNEALLGIFFGRLGAEVKGPLLEDGTLSPNAHPRVLQLEVDLRSLTDIEPGKDFILGWQGNMRKRVWTRSATLSSVILISMSFACAHCMMLNVQSGSLHTYEIPQKRRPIVHLNAPFPWRLEPNVSFARPR